MATAPKIPTANITSTNVSPRRRLHPLTLVPHWQLMQVSSFGEERAFRFSGGKEHEGGGVVDNLGGGIDGASVDIATIGALERDFVSQDGATDGELLVADIGVERDSVMATGASVDFAASYNPSVKVGDGLINLDVAFGDKDDLGSEVLGVGAASSRKDVGADD